MFAGVENYGLEEYQMSKPQNPSKYWYFISWEDCVLCGAHREYRARRYTPRPKEWKDRHEIEEYACMNHFM